MATLDLVVGWSADLDFQLKTIDPITGVESAQNLSGMTVELILKRSDGTPIDTTGDDVSIPDAANGKVRYIPDAADFAAPDVLLARWKVTQASKVAFFPNGEPDRWEIHAQ